MRLAKIIISEISDNQIVFLKEVDGERQFPILIGIFEATSIDRRVKKIARPRPLTHDLLAGIVHAMGGELNRCSTFGCHCNGSHCRSTDADLC